MIVHNTTDRIEGFSPAGMRKVNLLPGRNEISEEQYLALATPEGDGSDSVFMVLAKSGALAVEGELPKIPEKKPETKKEVKQVKKDLSKIRKDLKKSIRKDLKKSIRKAMANKKARSMKFDDLAEDFLVERDEIKALVEVHEGKEDEAKLFLQWLESEIANAK